MGTNYYNAFDTARIDADGVRIPLSNETFNITLVGGGSLGTVDSDDYGYIADGGVSASAGDIIEFSHATYPELFRRTLAGDAADAALLSANAKITYIAENLSANREAVAAEVWAEDLDDPDTRDQLLGYGPAGTTSKFSYETLASIKNLRIYLQPITADGEKKHLNYKDGDYGDIAITSAFPESSTAQAAHDFWAGPTSGADAIPTFRPIIGTDLSFVSSFGLTLIDDANASTARTTLGLVIGTNVQAFDAELAAIAGLTSAANKVPYFTGSGTAAMLDFDTDITLAAASSTRIPSQSAVKSYVDNLLSGLNWKLACRAATTGNITLSGTQTIDGVSVIAGDRVLVKAQSTGSQNGIYLCASGSWTRTTDADAGTELVNATVYVSEGTVNADTQWTCTTNATITVGSTTITFAQSGGSSSLVVGNAVTSGGADRVLYENGSQNLAASSSFTFDGNSLFVQTSSASAVPFTVKGASSQTAHYFDVKKSNGNVLASIEEDSVGAVLNIHANNGTIIGFYRINSGGGTSGLDLAGYNFLNLVNAGHATEPIKIQTFGNAGGVVETQWHVYNRNFNFAGYDTIGGEVIMKDLSNSNEVFHSYLDSSSANHGVRFATGKQSFGFNAAAAAQVEIRATTEQLRLSYDGSNRATISISSVGRVSLNAAGSGAKFTFSKDVEFDEGINLIISDGNGSQIGQSDSSIGLWGATPISQPTVTGSRGGNAALASLLTQLASWGAIINSTSA